MQSQLCEKGAKVPAAEEVVERRDDPTQHIEVMGIPVDG